MEAALLELRRHAKLVGAVVVSFIPDMSSLLDLLQALSEQVDVIIVVDNGSGDSVTNQLTAFAAGRNIELTLLATNSGIAAAQNIGIDRLALIGVEYVILFDQDSLPASDMVDRLVEAHLELRSKGMHVAALGPLSIDQRTGTLGRFVRIQAGRISRVACRSADDVLETDFLISSGSLISMDAIRVVGKMNEGYFIDHVDTEWCIRARMVGWHLFGVCSARLQHAIGDRVIRIWFGRWREVAIHSPLRDYYKLRNTVLMLMQIPMPWRWQLAHLRRSMMLMILTALVAPARTKRLGLMLKGIWHGLQQKSGSLSSLLP